MSNLRGPKGELKRIPLQQRLLSTGAGVVVGLIVSSVSHAGWGILAFFLIALGLNMYLTHRYNQGPTD